MPRSSLRHFFFAIMISLSSLLTSKDVSLRIGDRGSNERRRIDIRWRCNAIKKTIDCPWNWSKAREKIESLGEEIPWGVIAQLHVALGSFIFFSPFLTRCTVIVTRSTIDWMRSLYGKRDLPTLQLIFTRTRVDRRPEIKYRTYRRVISNTKTRVRYFYQFALFV